MEDAPPRGLYWPGHHLVPFLDLLQFQLLPGMEEFERHRRAVLDLEQLPYCLGAASYALLELVSTQDLVVRADLASPLPAGIHVLGPYERDRLAFLVDSVLEALRRAQNGVIPYLNRARHLNLGISMHHAVDLLQKNPVLLPGPERPLLLDYWRDHGYRLKQYRDLSQHFTVVSSDARTFISSDGQPSIYLVLPNNPEEKRPSHLCYEEPLVHAIPYLHDQVLQLLRLANILCDYLLDKTQPRRVSLGQPLKGPVHMGRPQQGHRVISVEAVIRDMRARIRDLPDPIAL
jgi:hypothetical protein